MLFNSKIFICLFLPITLIGFFWISRRYSAGAGRIWLLAASLVFYAWWSVPYLFLLVGWMVMNFAFGRLIMARRVDGPLHSRRWLVAGVAVNLGLLGYYKYSAFIVENVAQLTGVEFAVGAVVLPLAISFHTFQQIAYLVDVHHGRAPRYTLLDYLLFVSFFPQLIAGPIVHHYELMPYFKDERTYRFNPMRFAEGLAFFVLGLLKKLLLADPISGLATPVFMTAATQAPSVFDAWGAAVAFALGLYFDFSAYSDMAVGLARMFGITLPYNFNSPYKATSIIDFWRRWHMTLSRWLRDYLYISLGGNRKGGVRRYVNLMATMLLGGLWHGAAWTFVVWGALHGAFLIVNHAWNGFAQRAAARGRPLAIGAVPAQILTLLAVTVAWVFFAAPNFTAATSVLQGMLGVNGLFAPRDAVQTLMLQGLAAARDAYGLSGIAENLAAYSLLLIGGGIVLFAPNSQQIIDGRTFSLEEAPAWQHIRFVPNMATAVAAACALLLSLSLMTDVKAFVYFQF
jgi:alginate O-acetyltransferase complex protein AlgI